MVVIIKKDRWSWHMKNKYHNELKILSYIISTEKYKVIFFCSLILALYGSLVLGITADNFLDSILIPLRFPIFNIFMFAIIFVNNINTCTTFQNDFSFYIIRLKSKKEYIRTLIRLTIYMYLFHILVILLFIFIIFLLTTFKNIAIYTYQNYTINNLIYTCFYLIRYIIFGLLLTIISSLIYINTNEKVILTLDFIFLIFFLDMDFFLLQGKENMPLLIWSYFTYTFYSSFSLELAYSLGMLIILESIIIILYRLSLKSKKVIIT